ncbi:MAG: hypothetical protein UY63_C0011G0012 [Parcubacteria group bacterium GW2011_GWA2_51_10]|nr:MAG: hypothetical protein UY63_C0011G0012 [Parcubacteria group bacterium GW2011_GWA2_51_10]
MEPAIIDPDEQELQQHFKDRFTELPKPVQSAIKSVDIPKRLRELAQKNQLHLDQWELLETEVNLILYGFQPAEKLEENIKIEVGVSEEAARALADDISATVFESVRAALESATANTSKESGDENPRPLSPALAPSLTSEEGDNSVAVPTASPTPATLMLAPSTPPAPPPQGAAVRAPLSESSPTREKSHERQNPEGDPYREQIT